MRTLGEAVDFALCDQGLTPAELTAILSNALEMKQFERGMPRVVCGMAGDELARDIIAHAGQPIALEYDSQAISSVKL